MVFYRTYRPQKIDDLDSSAVRETLHAVLSKNIPHAFLFTGPKGLGKTSTARIVAKVVNCETPVAKRENGLEPCNTCNQCTSITNGTNVDILEIDAASNRGIDEIRELKEKIRLAPVASKRKVYIIDEVHMLTTEAFNALLKTLEEPPLHAMFILCTTEAHKVPETIVSRCFQILFKPATEEELVRSFKRIVKGENLDVDDDALKYIAQLADRGFRDGVKVLEEINLISQGQKITKQLIESTFKTTKIVIYVIGLLKAMEKKDKGIKEGLEIIQSVINEGIDVKYFLNNIIERLHNDLLDNVGITSGNGNADYTFSLDEIKQLTELFSKAYVEMKTAVLPQLPVELAVIEWCDGVSMQTNQNVIPAKVVDARTGAGNQDMNGSRVPKGTSFSEASQSGMTNEDDTEVSVSSLRKQVGTMKKLKALYGEKKKEPEIEADIETTSVELMHTNGNGPVTKEWMEMFWRNFITEIKKHNHTLAGVMHGCTIKSFGEQTLVIQTAYKFHKERLDDMKNREALLRIGKLLTGKDIEITVELRK